MHKILVRLPMDRDYAGLLEVQTPGGTRIAGPYEVCGRADDQLARDHRNPERNPLLPFGDIPYGEYWVAGLKGSGAGTEYASEEYGPAGVVVLEPRNGDAALADANGRFRFLIHGGKPASQGGLRPTDGSLRLSNRDQRDLVGVLRRLERSEGTCLVVQAEHLRTRPVVTAPADLEPRFARIVSALSMSNLSRRSRTLGVFWLRAMMGATYALVAARSAFGFSLSSTQADPAGNLRSALLAKGASSSLSGKPNFARGRLYAQAGGDYTQQAPEEQAPTPQEQAPAAQEPGTNTDAMQQLQNTEQSSQQAAQNPSLEGAHEQASQPFDQGGQPAPAAPPAPAPAPVEAAPQEETPAPQDEEQQPEEETPAPQEEEQTPAPEEQPAPEEETPSAPAYQAPTPARSEERAPAPQEQTPAQEEWPVVPERQTSQPSMPVVPLLRPAAPSTPKSSPTVVPNPVQSVHTGAAAAVTGEVYWLTSGGRKVPITPGTPVFLNEHIVTGSTGRLQILLLDQTVFTMGPSSDMVLDEFVYDPSTNLGKISAQITKGIFRFVTGKVKQAQPYDMKVTTPVDCLCFRGTDVEAMMNPDGTGYVRLYKGKVDIVQLKTHAVFSVEAGHMVTLKADGSIGKTTPIKP